MAETVKIDIFADSSSIKELKQQLLEARNQLSGLEAGSEGFQNVARRAGELKDQMTDINEQVAIFAGGSKFEQAGTALGQVKDALFNLDFQGASEKAKALTTIISSISFKEATAGLGQLGSTFLSLGKALLTNPLFLIPAAITGILVAFGALGPLIDGVKNLFNLLGQAVSDFLDYIGVTNTKLDELAEKEKKAKEAADKQTEAIRKESTAFVTLIAQLSTTNKNSKERATLIKDINKEYGTTLKNISDETSFQNQLNLAVEEYIKQKYAEFALKANEEKLVELFEKKSKAASEYDKQLKSLTDGYTLVDKEQGLYLSNTAKSDKVLDRTTGKYVSAAVTLGDLRDKNSAVNTVLLEQEKIIRNTDAQILAIGKSSLQYANAQKAATVATKTTTKAVEELKDVSIDLEKSPVFGNLDAKDLEQYYKLINKIFSEPLPAPEIPDEAVNTDIVDEATKEVNQYWAELELGATKSYEGYKTLMQERMEEEIRVTNATGAEADLIRQKYADKEIERQRAVSDARLQIATDSLSLISNVTELFAGKSEKDAEKAFNVNKAVGIAQATIQTYQAAQAAYLSQLSIPSPDAPVRAAIAAGVAVAAGIANIAKIAQTQYKGSTPSGGNSFANAGTVTTPAQPSFQLFGTAGQANNVNAGTGQQVQTINVNASVSVDQITDTQKKLVQINQSKTL